MALRGRIAVRMLTVVAVSGGASAVIGGYLLRQHLVQEARNRVQHSLNAAQEFYSQRLEAMDASLRYTALGERFCQAVVEGDTRYLSPRLEAVRQKAGLDILYVTDHAGRVIHRAHHPELSGDLVAADRLVRFVLNGKDAASATMLIPMDSLRQEDSALEERARIRLLPTPEAEPTDTAWLASGMMLCAAARVPGPDGKLAGVLRAGTLLNRNHSLVDKVQNTVFRDELYRGRLLGVATVFQGDVRISTLLRQEDGSRAIGSRSSAEVREHVLRGGKTWAGRAWVFDQWYITAYAPIYDIDGNTIGMLAVGVAERKSQDAALRTLMFFGFVTLAGLAAAGMVAWQLAEGISRPVRDLAVASTTIAKGDFGHSLPVAHTDEIGALTQVFNFMAQSLKERDELLAERTRLQLTRSEQLASIGRLAAGVAHEINNPLTGVVTFAHMLLRNTREGSQERGDAQMIIDSASRCQKIVRGLLEFSRQNEPQRTPSDLNCILRRALDLTRNQASISRVKITEDMDPSLPQLVVDPDQIEEVAVNVIVNAIDAMPEGGDLTIRTRVREQDEARWAELEIRDTGSGIPQEDLERIFDPFFTTKQTGQGTGLGLAVTYGIVHEHGGDIDVASEVGRGTTVRVRLPLTPEGIRP